MIKVLLDLVLSKSRLSVTHWNESAAVIDHVPATLINHQYIYKKMELDRDVQEKL
jgi:hypothetical protein